MLEKRTAITLSNILLVVITGLALVLLWQLRSLIVILMIAIVLAATIVPPINKAERMGIPRWLAVIVVYLMLIGILTGAILLIGPTVAEQIQRLVVNFPTFLEALRALIENLVVNFNAARPELVRQVLDPQSLTSWAIRSSQQLVLQSYGLTKGIVGGILSLILSILISAYIVIDSKNLVSGFVEIFPTPWDQKLASQVKPVGDRMGNYIQGRVLVSGILGIATSIGLSFLGLSEFALGLGAIAGFTNLIPFVGPILGAVPALIVSISFGGWTFLWVLLLFVIIQNLETYLLDPLLVGSSVRVHPLYQLLAVLAGTQVLGIIGALIVPPWVAGASVLLENLYLKPKQMAQISSSSQTEVVTEIKNHR